MRIGYLVPEFPGQTHIFFWREIQVLRKQGVEVCLLSTRRPSAPSRHAFGPAAQAETQYLFPPRYGLASLHLLRRPLLAWRMLLYLWGLKATSWFGRLRLMGLMLCAADLLLRAKKEGLEHVHGHSCADVGHLLALADRCGDLPYSLTLHGDLPVYGKDHDSKFARAKFIACVTFALQKQVHETCGLPMERLPVIRMGVDVQKFQPGTPHPVEAGSMNMITVARLAECKGHVFAIRALRKVIDRGLRVTYTIVGDGEERPLIEAEIKALQLEKHVHLVGTAGEHEVLQFLYRSDCFILPSVGFGEAAPVSVMEAMACQLPVIASIIGGTPEMIQPDRNGILVPQRDVEGLAAAITKLSGDGALRSSLAQAARQTAVAEFSAETFARALQKAISR